MLRYNLRVPEWALYQLNGKSAQENYIAQKEKRREASSCFDSISIEAGLRDLIF